jgi:dTDP-4-amino-4,6-dideoxygalactose transaminase
MIPHSRPYLGDDLECAAREITASGMIGSGPRVDQLEREFARLHGTSDAVATGSGTAALHLVLLALGIGPGNEVILPGYVCTAVLNAIRYVGATPVLADVDPETFNLDCGDVRSKRTRHTRAIIVPHMFGNPADVASLRSLGVPVIEDCAQALGAIVGPTLVGSLGDIAVFSFHATKVITTGAGGMIVAKDPSLLANIRDLRDYDEKETYVPRYNYQMTDLAAAIGLRQLLRLPEFIRRRRALAALYTQRLADSGIQLPRPVPGSISYRYVIRTELLPAIQAALAARGIQAKRPVYKPLHHYVGGCLPATDHVYRTSLSIPIYPAVTDREVECVVSTLVALHDGAPRLDLSHAVATVRIQ